MKPRIPIVRIGWRDALQLIKNKGFTLLVKPDGRGELLEPRRHVMGGKHSSIAPESAVFHLTKRSVELLQSPPPSAPREEG